MSRQLREHGVEARPLLGEERVIGIVGGRKVRIDRIDFEVRAAGHFGQRSIDVVVPEPEPVHPGVDLEMTPQGDATGRGRRLKRPRRARRGDGWRQVMVEHAVEVADTERAKHEDRRPDPRLPQHDRLLDIRAGKHGGAGILERARDLGRAVAVGIGLDDGDEAGRRTAGGREIRGNRTAVATDRVEIDAGDGRPDHGDPWARFSNLVNSLMNASLAVPVGPLRCLPMMISATPCASWLGWPSSSRYWSER